MDEDIVEAMVEVLQVTAAEVSNLVLHDIFPSLYSAPFGRETV